MASHSIHILAIATLVSGCVPLAASLPPRIGAVDSARAGSVGTGTLSVRILWPQRDLPNFRAQTIPLRTNSLRLTVRDASQAQIDQRVLPRQPGSATAATIPLPAGTGYQLTAEAFAEAAPSGTSVAIAQGSATNVPIWRSKTTLVPLTLTATFAPVISRMDPSYGPIRTPVQLTGSNFGAALNLSYSVTFGGVTAEATRSSDTAIAVLVPPGTGTPANVVVTVDGVPSTTVAPFIVGATGFDVTVVPAEQTFGPNGLAVGLTTADTSQGFGLQIGSATTSVTDQGLAVTIQ